MKRLLLKRIPLNNTKIVATIGPASHTKEIINKLVLNGVDIFRLNFSHGNHNSHLQSINIIKALNKRYDLTLPIFIDLQGPKIRVDNLENDKIELNKNSILEISPDSILGNNKIISISYKQLYKYVNTGDKLLLDDGKITLSVIKIKNKIIYTKVIISGILRSKKGINLPNTNINIPSLTEKDKKDIKFGISQNIETFALSFVRESKDIIRLKKYIKKLTSKPITIIAKIEKPQAVKNIKLILKEVDGIMVARGDLGVEVSPEKVPCIQKQIINLTKKKHKFVITATQMLESMIENTIPTRAEATDVFNAVLDGTDAVMLSGETAAGKFPVKTVHMMYKILKNAEIFNGQKKIATSDAITCNSRELISQSIYNISIKIKPKYIITFSNSGKTVQILSSTRSNPKIIAFTPKRQLLKKLSFYYGVFPFQQKMILQSGILVTTIRKLLLRHNLVKEGDNVLLTFGIPLKEQPETNSLIICSI